MGRSGFNFPYKSFNYMLCLFLQLVDPPLKKFCSGQPGGCTQVIQQKWRKIGGACMGRYQTLNTYIFSIHANRLIIEQQLSKDLSLEKYNL